jgi:uncharacterized membrane protein
MFESVAANLYRAVMLAGHVVCQQNPARSPHLFGAQLPLCWRCTGIALGSFAFLVWLFAERRPPALWLSLALAALMPLDVLHAILTHTDGDNARRLVTGALWGFFAAGLALHFFTWARALRLRAGERGRDAAAAARAAVGESA